MADTDKMYTSVAAEKKKMQLLKSEFDAVKNNKADKATTLAGYGIQDAYTKTEVNGLVDTPHQNYVTVQSTAQTTDATDVLPASGQAADTIYRVSNWDGSANNGAGAFDVTKYSEYAWDDASNPNKYVFLCVKTQVGEVFDISVYNNNATYPDLATALGTNGANVPQEIRRGGMTVKFVRSSDNEYVRYDYMGSSTAVADFTNVANWRGVDEVPRKDSRNLITSGSVYAATLNQIAIQATVEEAVITVKVDDVIVATGTGSLTTAIEYGKVFTVECSRVYDYITPEPQTFTASPSVQKIFCNYTYIPRDIITIDQTITDPATMITGDVQGDVIKQIRANSHLYLGTPATQEGDTEGTELICQLDDEDSTKYADGTTAVLDGSEGDQWLKLPIFWWKVIPIGEAAEDGSHDQYSFAFAFAGEPDPSWNRWVGEKNLLGTKEMKVVDGVGHSVSGGTSTGSFTQAKGNTYAAANNLGGIEVTWEWQWMMCMLFYAWYGNTNSQAVCGIGSNSYSRTLGVTDGLGMSDTTPAQATSLTSARFWGLESWWNCKYEWMGNVTSNNYVLTIKDINTKQNRTVSGFVQCAGTYGWTSRMKITEQGDFIPVALGATDATSYCDATNSNSGSRVVFRSGHSARSYGGVAYVNSAYAPSDTGASVGSRLAFNGVVTEAESVAAYKAALPAGQEA